MSKHPQNRIAWRISLALAVVALALLSACSSAPSLTPAVTGSTPELFTIPQDQISHIQIVTLQPTSMTRTLRLTGTVAFNGFDTTPVFTQVSGPVSRIAVTPGEQVRHGQPLLYVASPDYSQSLANYLKARDAYELADNNYARSKDLLDHHAMAVRDFEAAASARTQAAADLGAAEESLRVLGISNPESMIGKPAKADIPVLAPIDGQAVERLVAPGQVIQAGSTQVFTISNMSSVWVMANIYQKDLPYVRLGDPVTITTDSYPGTEFHGNISYIAAALDPDTRTLQARIDVKNPQGKLKKDMYVVAEVQGGVVRNALLVPFSAVMRDAENQPFVYVVNQNNQFSRRPITLGDTNTTGMQLTSGVVAGERVVGDGSLFLQFANSLQQ